MIESKEFVKSISFVILECCSDVPDAAAYALHHNEFREVVNSFNSECDEGSEHNTGNGDSRSNGSVDGNESDKSRGV